MRTNITSLIVAASIGIAAQQAAAVVTFQFDDNPDPDGQFIYTAPDFAGQLGFLTYNSEVPVDLDVDATGEGAASEFGYTDATFSFSADVGAINAVPFLADTYFAPLTNGSFSFFTNALDGNELIYSGAFGNDIPAQLVIVVDTGSIRVSVEVGGLFLTPGARLLDDLSAAIGGGLIVEGFVPPFDAVWTLSNMPNLTTIVPPGGGNEVFLNDFQANSSFSGTAGLRIVPAPGAAAIAGLGIGLVGFRRRR